MDKEINEEERVGEGGIWWEESYGKKALFLEDEELLEGGKTVCMKCLFFGCGEFVLWVFGEPEAGGTGLLGVLGTGAKISLRYLGAREPNRMLLASREENTVLGSVWHGFNFSIGPTK